MLAAGVGLDQNLLATALNPAVVVFREGLEAVLILAALTASFGNESSGDTAYGLRCRVVICSVAAAPLA